MKYEIYELLDDIISSIDKVKKYVHNMDYNDYLENELIQDAVERRFEIIVEAVDRISKEYPEIFKKITDGVSIIGTRHKIIHHYDKVKSSVLFKASGKDLSGLKDEIIA